MALDIKSSYRNLWRFDKRHMTTCSYFFGNCFSTSVFNRLKRNGRNTYGECHLLNIKYTIYKIIIIRVYNTFVLKCINLNSSSNVKLNWKRERKTREGKKLRTDLMQTTDYVLVVLAVPFDHACDRIAKPLFKFAMRLKNVRHKKVHERPQFHQIVLKGCAGKEQSPATDKWKRYSDSSILFQSVWNNFHYFQLKYNNQYNSL